MFHSTCLRAIFSGLQGWNQRSHHPPSLRESWFPIAPYCKVSVSDCCIRQAYSGGDLVIESFSYSRQKPHSNCSCQSIQKPVIILWKSAWPFCSLFGRPDMLWSKQGNCGVLKIALFLLQRTLLLLLGNNVNHWRFDLSTNI